MKTYQGIRKPDGSVAVTVTDGSEIWALDPRLDLRNHSPTGFEWGYGGSGPSQLALALCADALCIYTDERPKTDERAKAVYQHFKWQHVAKFPREEWMITDAQIRTDVAYLEGAHP